MQETLQQQQLYNSWEEQWQFAKPLIAKAVKYQDLYTLEDIECKIREGYFLLWVHKNSAMVTECVEFPQMRTINILFCGGKYKELEDIFPHIIDFCKKAGIKRMYGGGRKSWTRKIAKHWGWKDEYAISKDI